MRKNSRTKVFKVGKQFALFVVIPERQWEELEEFRKRELRERASGPATGQNAGFAQWTPYHSGAFLQPPSMPPTVASSNGRNLSTSRSITFVNNHSAVSGSISSAHVVPAPDADTLPSVNENLVSQAVNMFMLVAKWLLEYSL